MDLHLGFLIISLLSWTTKSLLQTQPHLQLHRHQQISKARLLATSYRAKICTAIDQISRNKWNSFISEVDSPFIEYDWLHALEVSRCVSPDNGWTPLHVAVYNDSSFEDDSLVALSPMYVKYDSYGEFIFDQSWASYCESVLKIPYYPKLLTAIPFTPATGTRVIFCKRLRELPAQHALVASNEITSVIAQSIMQLVAQNRLSSAHVNFMQTNEVPVFLANSFLHRQTIQYRYYLHVSIQLKCLYY